MDLISDFFSRCGRLLLASLIAAGCASADSIHIVGVDYSRAMSIRLWEAGTGDTDGIAGVIDIELISSDGSVHPLDTLCVDLFTNIYLGQTYTTHVYHPSQIPDKNLLWVSWLIDNAMLPTQEKGFPSALDQADWLTSPVQGAGIQLAIWDIVHDGGDGFYAGRVRAATGTLPTDQVLLAAQRYEDVSRGHTSGLAYVYDNYTGSDEYQMLAGPRFEDGGPHPTPEPSTLVLIGAALIALSLIGRRYHARRTSTSAGE